MTTTASLEAPPRLLPVELVDGPAGLFYLIPRGPLTLDECEALAVVLAARAAAARDNATTDPLEPRP